MIRVRHVSWLLSPLGGGIPPAIEGLAGAQGAMGMDVGVLGVEDPSARPIGASGWCAVLPGRGPRALGWCPQMATALRRERPDLVHLHGLFTWPSRVVNVWGRRTGRPVVVSPHGMLEPWALARSAWKKRAFMALVEKQNLVGAACLHALCEPEACNLRRLGIRNPVAVIPNGVDLDALPAALPRSAFDRCHPEVKDRNLLLFLGRVHPKKGLPHLFDAWATVRAEGRTHDWMLVVAGPDQVGHAGELRARAESLGLDDVVFTGPLQDERKFEAYSAAQGFVLPSFSEGLPMAVLEAMAFRLPALVTRQCNLDVEAMGAGLLSEPDALSLAAQLRTFFDMSGAERRVMGEHGRRAVEEHYSWPKVALDTAAVYEWLLGERSAPNFVEISA